MCASVCVDYFCLVSFARCGRVDIVYGVRLIILACLHLRTYTYMPHATDQDRPLYTLASYMLNYSITTDDTELYTFLICSQKRAITTTAMLASYSIMVERKRVRERERAWFGGRDVLIVAIAQAQCILLCPSVLVFHSMRLQLSGV